MKFFLLLFYVSIFGHAISQDRNPLAAISPSNESKFVKLVSSFDKKHRVSEIKTIRHLFNKAHRQFLKKYEAYASVEDIFEKGNYDCLSGTYFLSGALGALGIKHHIIETNYHIFLIAETNRGEVLLESTDRFNG